MNKAKMFLVLIILVLFISCSSTNSAVKNELKLVENLDFSMDPYSPPEDYSSIILKEYTYINAIDGKPNSLKRYDYILTSGYHSFDVKYMNSGQESTIVPLSFNFEPNKSYYLDYEISSSGAWLSSTSSIRFFITDLTDPSLLEYTQKLMTSHSAEIEEMKATLRIFHEYTKANEGLIEGRWIGETKRLMNTFYIEYDFSGNRMIYNGKSKHAGMRPYVMEGNFLFNENIIILLPEKVLDNEKETNNFKEQYKWFYSINGDVLQLEGGGTVGSAFIWETDGKFQKAR